jgi:hypothetical protein
MSFMRAFIVTLSVLLLFEAGATDVNVAQNCGRIIRHTRVDAAIFALCPSLPDLDAEQLAVTVAIILKNAGGVADETVIYFFNDESVVEPRSGWPQDLGRRIKSWGTAYVGWHKLHSGKVTIRDRSAGGWRTVELPFPQVPSNNALHLRTTPVIILASARMPPYAGFQVSLNV